MEFLECIVGCLTSCRFDRVTPPRCNGDGGIVLHDFLGEGSCLDFLGSYLACFLSVMLQQPFLL